MGHVEREAPSDFTVVLHRDCVARIDHGLNLSNRKTLRPHVLLDFLDRPVEFFPPAVWGHLSIDFVKLAVSSDLAPEVLKALARRRYFVPTCLLHEAGYPGVKRHDAGILRFFVKKIAPPEKAEQIRPTVSASPRVTRHAGIGH